MLILIMSVGAVCAAENITEDIAGDDSQDILETVPEDIMTDDSSDILKTTQNDIYATGEGSFTNLTEEIMGKTSYDLTRNYKFNEKSDRDVGIIINTTNFVLNGNGSIIDGKNLSRIFNITANNVTINDLTIINGNAEKGAAIYATKSLTLNNVTFINNYASKNGGAVAVYEDVTINCNNSKFIDNYAGEGGSSFLVLKGKLNLYNSYITSKIYAKAGQIMGSIDSQFYLENITFANTTATYAPAIYLVGSKIRIIDSKFINLKANLTAGAMSLREGGEIYIKNCEFINTTSSRNAGAIYADITGYVPNNVGNVTIIDSKFKDVSSEFGGAYVQLGGQFWINNSEFTNNHAIFNGGAVYLSFTETQINNCTFESNGVDVIEGYPTYGGAIFSDISTLNITDSKFFNNIAGEGNAIYAYDSSFNIKGSTFKNNTNAVFSVFTKNYTIDTTTELNNDTVSTNNTFYATIIVGEGLQLTLVNNTINVDVIPAKFDLRDREWVSPVKDQGWMGACWTFGMTSALESVLLKATGIPFNISMNNMKTVMKYSPYGAIEVFEGGANLASVGYLLSWLGTVPYDADTYDELGKITMPIVTDYNIHIQDIMFIPNNEIPNGTQIKLAIMKYGSLDVSFFGQASFDDEVQYYNPKTNAQYVDLPEGANHEVSIIGWDDNFPKEKFSYTPPGNGAWIVKNSYGSEWGDNGYLYVSYYDKSLLAYKPGKVTDYAATAIIENTVPYNKNYQYDITWLSNYGKSNGTISYANVFEALDDDLIAGVGTYFNESGVNYTVKIFVNDELRLTQEGVSPYVGFHTIKLGSYVPIKKGDVFKAEITSNWVPYLLLEDTRVHYTQNISFVSFDGKTWKDAYDLGYIVCLKVYTVADTSFSKLEEAIANSTENYMELDDDYQFNNGTDDRIGIFIGRDNFVLNGNGHIIDANNQSRIFAINANNVTLSNLILINGNADNGGAIYTEGSVTLNNVTFINNYATKIGGAIALSSDIIININNSRFIDNHAVSAQSIYIDKGKLNIYNTEFTSNVYAKDGQIVLNNATIYIDKATFANIKSDYAPAIRMRNSKSLTVLNSKFINLTANITAGAIAVKGGGEIYIRNCEFTNITSSKNAGAILADIVGSDDTLPGNVTILDTVFRDTSSGFGGAFIQFGGKLIINNTEFINNHATYNGGAVYISYVGSAEVNDCNFTSNGVDIIEGYPTYGGAMVIDMSSITINHSRFINNTASEGNAIYAYDAAYAIKNSLFENNTNAIYSFFDKNRSFENNTFSNDGISLNNTFYATIQVGEGMPLTLINNAISVDTLPKRFDLRDWGWVSPVRNQGWMGACWTFGMTGTLESALLKATGIAADLSENNMQNTMLKYSNYGITSFMEGGANIASLGYLLSWLGSFIQDADTYDELGKLSPLITTNHDIHVLDVMFTPNNEIPNGTQLKLAIMKYGSIDVSYNGQSTYNEVTPYYKPDTYAQYVNDSSIQPNHAVSIVGWDDNFPKEKFGITPPGDGAWIVKNSWGSDFGDNGFLYVSYYDQSLLKSLNVIGYATSIILENTVPYNKNYQYDMFWGCDFVGNGTVSYYNQFEALDDDLIAAVGTYFNQSGINYTVEIYVNDVLKLTQEGVSPYYGYHTIKLDSYIPIKKGDVFKAVMTSNGVPRMELKDSRIHYTDDISFVSFDGQSWQDAYKLGYIACLKVYTVADDSKIINNKDISVDYAGGKYFSVKVVTADGHAVGAGAKVTFTINKKTKTVTTDKNGIAKIKITDIPKKYTITTKYNGKTYKNTVTVKQVLKASKVTVKKSAKKFTLKATLKINGKLVKGKVIKFKFKGKTYKVKTNKKGVAQKTLTKKVIKKLKKGKKYTVKVTYKKDTIKTTVKVKK